MRLIDADALLEALEIEIHKKYPFSLKDLITNAPTVEQGEPFGYFKAEPFGWTDCARTDEGAVALYEASPQKQWVGLSDEQVEELVETHCDDIQTLLYKYEAKLKELNHD